MMQCTSCGTAVALDSRSCSKCGATLDAGDATVAIPMSIFTPPRTSSTTSRLAIAPAPDEGRFLAGTLVAGRYRIIGLLGRGGMGEVYRATDLTLGQSVALKFLPEHAASDERLLERFHNEVRIARQVSHPNVCRVYDIGEAEGLPFISMEYIDGEDLASLLHRIGRLPNDKALEISRKLCAGLAAAHERGVIHRDLKPQNIMLNKRGEVVIMDFGLAAVADALEGAEARNGTPAYMSPEQLRGVSVTARSDIYGLGLIIYELFTGRRAFEAQNMADLIRMQETSRPAQITTIASDVDPQVEKVILRCLEIDPAQRPPNPLAVSAALPGGDPLAAALAAGETPSPELVAASGEKEGFPLRYAVIALVFVLATLAVFPWLMQPISLIAASPVDFPTPVLEQKAREIAAIAGYTSKPADWAGWFFVNIDLISYFEKKGRGPHSWKQLFEAESPVRFFYRQSPKYLAAFPDGNIASDRPSMDVPGMLAIQLDSRGRLRRFDSVVAPYDPAPATAPVFDPALILRQAGLDYSQFHEVPPVYAPSMAFDARYAWSAPYPGLPDTEITVEMATWRGRLTSFITRWPWTKPPSTREEPWQAIQLALVSFTYVFLAVGLCCAWFFARRSLRSGRADRAGAYRFAAAAFILFVIYAVVRIHVIPSFDMVTFLFEQLSVGLALVTLLWLGYVALEPAVRARWPHSLITWNRLLAGNLGDPRLGSHILMGVVVGMAMCLLFLWRSNYLVAHGRAPREFHFIQLMGVRAVLSNYAGDLFRAMLSGSMIFFVLCGLRRILRRDWIAALAAAILLTFQEGSVRESQSLSFDLPLYVAAYFVLSFILLRMGLVPAIVCIFAIQTAEHTQASSDLTAWYNPTMAVQLAMLTGIALYGFWRSQSRPGLMPAATTKVVR